MESNNPQEVRAKGPSAAEREWRQAMRAAGYQVAPTTIRVHPSQLLSPSGDKRAAEAAYRRFVVSEPENLMALDGLAFLLQHRGASKEVIQMRRQRYAAESRRLGVPESEIPAVVDFLASSLGDGQQPGKPPVAYIEKMFDDMAAIFDDRLVTRLGYRGPELLWEAVEPLIGDRTGELNVLDLGCGTGLTGAAFRAVAGRLVGVDLSPRMLGYAQQRGVYDELQQCDLVEFLQSTDERFDLIVAADVLIYLGDLVRAFEEIGRVLRPGGHWVASAECGEDSAFRLRGTRRYQHSREHLTEAAAKARLSTIALDVVELRREQGEQVRAWRGVWQRE